MELILGYVIGYHPENGTIDIRSTSGTPFNAMPFDASLAFYNTPVLPILREGTDATRIVKAGSFAILARFSDHQTRIIRIFNDDQDIIKNYSGHANRPLHGQMQDTLLAMLQDGEALMQAPGRFVETKPGIFERQPGSWMLLKNSGDAILSNADSSCEVWISYSGQFEVTGTKYRLIGADTKIQEDDAGTLTMVSGAARGTPVTLTLTKDAVATLTAGEASMVLSPTTYSVDASVVNISGGNEVNLDATTIYLTAIDTAIGTEYLDMEVTNEAILHAADIAVSADASLSLSAGTTMAASSSQSVMITAPQNAIVIDKTGTKITIDGDAKLTISVAGSSLEISKDGITIVPPAGQPVAIGSGSTTKQILIDGTTTSQGIIPLFSKMLVVKE